MDSPSRSRLRSTPARVPVHRRLDRRTRGDGQPGLRHQRRSSEGERRVPTGESLMDYLRRGSAPLSERVWSALDEAAAQAARHVLTGRRVATFDGPRGWEHTAARLGTMTPCASQEGKATVCVPEVVLLS